MKSLIRSSSTRAVIALGLTCVLAMSACTSQPPITSPKGTADVGPGGGEVEVEGEDRPALVADALTLLLPG